MPSGVGGWFTPFEAKSISFCAGYSPGHPLISNIIPMVAFLGANSYSSGSPNGEWVTPDLLAPFGSTTSRGVVVEQVR